MPQFPDCLRHQNRGRKPQDPDSLRHSVTPMLATHISLETFWPSSESPLKHQVALSCLVYALSFRSLRSMTSKIKHLGILTNPHQRTIYTSASSASRFGKSLEFGHIRSPSGSYVRHTRARLPRSQTSHILTLARLQRLDYCTVRMASTARQQPPWSPPAPLPPDVKIPKLKIYNSLTRKKEDFIPADRTGKTINWYTCGPTVYDHSHVWNKSKIDRSRHAD
jgi:hypothetical protein